MMYRLSLILLIVLTSCKPDKHFTKVDCNGSVSYMVFKPCRELTYLAKYWDKDHNLISQNKIWIMATGKVWEFSESQNELLIAYEYDSLQFDEIQTKSINKGLSDRLWQSQEATGVIENENHIWMHPFRSNQYNFMEVAPFPTIRLPIEAGMQWTGNLSIYEGWGDWANSTLNNSYEVIGYETIDTPYQQLDAWHVNSITSAPFGNSTHNFWFHPELGFVKMVIYNYAGQTLELELIEVIDS